MSIEKFMEFYQEWALIAAIALYIQHRVLPYDYREKFPYEDPPPKFLGSFSLGEFIQYIIQVLSFPIIIFMLGILRFSDNVNDVIGVILLLVWGFIPRTLSKKIDGW